MPTPQLLNSLIETAVNQALAWSNNSELALAPLVGKICIIHIQEFDHVLCFHFSETRIDVLHDENKLYGDMPEDLPEHKCWVSVSLFALDKLKQNNQLTKLIKLGQLDFAGNLGILQGLSGLLNKLDIDFEEVLAGYVGDPAAYQVNATGKSFVKMAKQQLRLLSTTISEAALDEKPVGVRSIMLVNFSDEVSQLRADTERFEARLQRLENRKVSASTATNKGSEQ